MIGQEIGWRDGKNLTRKAAGGGGKKKGKKGKEEETKEKAAASFFQFFSTPDYSHKYVDQQREIFREIYSVIEEDTEESVLNMFLDPYDTAQEFFEGVHADPENFEECFQSQAVQDRVYRLADVYAKVDAALKERQTEAMALEQKLQAECNELCQQRASILDASDPAARPPRFWLQCFLNSYEVSDFLGARDDRLLRYLKDVKGNIDKNGASEVQLLFWENPFFNNENLTREVSSDGSVDKSLIDWKYDSDGKSMQNKVSKKGKYSKKVDSLVWAFDSEDGPMDEEEQELLHMMLLRAVIPQAMFLYVKTPDALEDADVEDDDLESDDEDGDDEEEDEDDDEEEEGDNADKARSVLRNKRKGEKEAAEPGFFGNITLLHVFVLMIISAQICSFFMTSGM